MQKCKENSKKVLFRRDQSNELHGDVFNIDFQSSERKNIA